MQALKNVSRYNLFSWAPKSLQMVTAAMKLKYIWKESYDQPRQHIKKQRHYFANKVRLLLSHFSRVQLCAIP